MAEVIEIIYNNKTIAEIGSNKSVTLKCKDKFMRTDITFVTPEFGAAEITLQEKEGIFTENGEFEITPDEGYDGLSKVAIKTNVPTYIVVATVDELPTDVPEGTIAIIEG